MSVMNMSYLGRSSASKPRPSVEETQRNGNRAYIITTRRMIPGDHADLLRGQAEMGQAEQGYEMLDPHRRPTTASNLLRSVSSVKGMALCGQGM